MRLSDDNDPDDTGVVDDRPVFDKSHSGESISAERFKNFKLE